MSTFIKTLKDFFDNTVYPITKTNAVYDSNNNRLDNVLASKQDASSNFVYKGTGSATPSIDDPELRQSDISTTQSTSDITVPSSSLVKTMNDNLGDPSSASAVTGADAFSKISKLNSDLASLKQVYNYSANGTYEIPITQGFYLITSMRYNASNSLGLYLLAYDGSTVLTPLITPASTVVTVAAETGKIKVTVSSTYADVSVVRLW